MDVGLENRMNLGSNQGTGKLLNLFNYSKKHKYDIYNFYCIEMQYCYRLNKSGIFFDYGTQFDTSNFQFIGVLKLAPI